MKKCSQCQSQNKNASVFCTNCGAALATETVATPVVAPTTAPAKKGFSIAALVLGIIALLSSMLAPVGIICGLLAIIFAAIGMKRGAKGVAIGGMVTGILGFLGALFWGLIWGLIIGGAKMAYEDPTIRSSITEAISELEEFGANNSGAFDNFDDSTETKRVGSEELGFITLPANFRSFVNNMDDSTNTPALQWADGPGAEFGARIVTLDSSVDKSAEYAEIFSDPEMWAGAVMMMMEDYGSEDFEGAEVDFHGYDAYQVYGSFPEGTTYDDGTFDPNPTFWVVTIFEVEDGSVRYLSVEGPMEEDFFAFFESVTDSYDLEF